MKMRKYIGTMWVESDHLQVVDPIYASATIDKWCADGEYPVFAEVGEDGTQRMIVVLAVSDGLIASFERVLRMWRR